MAERWAAWGTIKSIVAAMAHVLRMRKPEESPAERERRIFRTAFQEAAVGMVILDFEGCIQSVNKGFTDLVQYSAGELTGRNLSSLLAEEGRDELAKDRSRMISGEIRSYRAERRFVRKDGQSLWIRSSVSLLKSDD